MTGKPLNLGALRYEGFEMLDLFGPLEMFSNAGHAVPLAPQCR
jgi:putative intracellular protease/amidase